MWHGGEHVAVINGRQQEQPADEVHVYEPHRAGLPRLGPYLRELWQRREFATELSRSNIRAAHTRTLFGQVWLVINPLLLAAVYYVLVDVLSNRPKGWGYFAHLTVGLFTFYFISGAMSTGASSVVSGGRLLMNTAFPRLLLPLSAVRTAFFRYLPTWPVALVFMLLSHERTLTWATPLAAVFLVLIVVFATGLAAVFATLQVYFRDTSSFLPYIVRIWLYLSPVLFFAEDMQKFQPWVLLNPLYSMLGGFTDLLLRGEMPTWQTWVMATAWAFGTLALGSWYLMSRERDFAVRI